MTAPLPFTLLTGFLGSGKTTLLRALLATPALSRAVVLINEVGEVGLDHLLVRHVREEVVVLESGCVCCTLREDLVAQLTELFAKRDRGELPPFERVVLETTGLADAAPVVQTVHTHALLAERLYLDGVIVTVDAQHAFGTLARFAESRKQLAVADRVVVTKGDLVASDELARVRAEVRALNPGCQVAEAVNGAIDPRFVLNVGHLDTRDVAHAPEGHGGHSHVQRTAVTLGEVDFRAFSLWVAMVTQFHGDHILRLKAVVTPKGEPTPVAVQAVQHVVYPPLTLPPVPELGRTSHVVLLSHGLSERVLRELESTLRELGGPARV